MDTIVDAGGLLEVVTDWSTDWNDPILRRMYYPTGVESRWHPDFIGQSAQYRNDGIYWLPNNKAIVLENGGNTKPSHIEEKPYPRPRGKYIYERGEWRHK